MAFLRDIAKFIYLWYSKHMVPADENVARMVEQSGLSVPDQTFLLSRLSAASARARARFVTLFTQGGADLPRLIQSMREKQRAAGNLAALAGIFKKERDEVASLVRTKVE
jgi:hypothetical protein